MHKNHAVLCQATNNTIDVKLLIAKLQLVLDQLVVFAFECRQFGMGAALYDMALLQHNDLVGILNGTEAMRNHRD